MLEKLSAKLNRLFPQRGYPRGINTDRKVERARRRYKRDTYPAETAGRNEKKTARQEREKKRRKKKEGQGEGNDRGERMRPGSRSLG